MNTTRGDDRPDAERPSAEPAPGSNPIPGTAEPEEPSLLPPGNAIPSADHEPETPRKTSAA